MRFVRGGRVFHFAEHGAGYFGTITTILVLPHVHGAVVKWTDFGRHVFKRPKCLTFDGMAAITLFSEKFAVGAN